MKNRDNNGEFRIVGNIRVYKNEDGPKKSKWPFTEIEEGECFYTPPGVLVNVSARAAKYFPKRFSQERQPDGGYKITRVKDAPNPLRVIK